MENLQTKKQSTNVIVIAQCALFAAILCICSMVNFAIGPIPFSMAFFGVMLASIVLGTYKGAVSTFVFVALGAVGLPVFSGGNGGFHMLVGATGGYIWSYIIMAAIIGYISVRPIEGRIKAIIQSVIACIIGGAVCYMFGTIQFIIVTSSSISHALEVCVLPFILPDIIKAIAASVLGNEVRRLLIRGGYLK